MTLENNFAVNDKGQPIQIHPAERDGGAALRWDLALVDAATGNVVESFSMPFDVMFEVTMGRTSPRSGATVLEGFRFTPKVRIMSLKEFRAYEKLWGDNTYDATACEG